MTESEIRTRLEKALHGRITWAEWRHLKDIELVSMYSRGSLDWQDFRESAADTVGQLRRFYANKQRELSNDHETEDEAESSSDGGTHQEPKVRDRLSDRTFAR